MKTRIIEILEHLNNLKYNAPIEQRTVKFIAKQLNSAPNFIHRLMKELEIVGRVKYIIAYPNGNHIGRGGKVHIYYLDTDKGRTFQVWAKEQRIV